MLPRLRFSLRTLLLAVLSLASLATLWWNWGPWNVAFVVSEPLKIQSVTLSEDDHFLLISYGDDVNNIRRVDVRRLPDGKRHTEIELKYGGSVNSIGRYIAIYENDRTRNHELTTLKLVDAQTLQSVGHVESIDRPHGKRVFSIYPTFIVYADASYESFEFCTLPDLKRITTFDSISEIIGQRNATNRMGLYRNGRLEILNFETGQSLPTEKVDQEIVHIEFTPTTMIGSAKRQGIGNLYYIFSLTDGKLLMTYYDNDTLVFTTDGSRYVTATQQDFELRDVFSGAIIAKQKIDSKKNLYFTIGEFSPDGTLFKDDLSYEIRDGRTLQSLWKPTHLPVFFSYDSNYLVLAFPWKIHQARTGELLMDFSSWRWKQYVESPSSLIAPQFTFSHHSGDFWTLQRDKNQLTYFHMTRPPTWLSIPSKPELWLSLVLCTAFIWSIWRGIK